MGKRKRKQHTSKHGGHDQEGTGNGHAGVIPDETKKAKTSSQSGKDTVTTAFIYHLQENDFPLPSLADESDASSDEEHPVNQRSFLDRFTHPFGSDNFMKDIYRRYCLAIKGGGMDRLQTLVESYLHELDISKLLHDSPSEKIFAWLKPRQNGSNNKQYKLDSIALDDPQHAMTCYEAGASLYFRAPQEMADELIPKISCDVGLEFGGLYQSNYVAIDEEGGNVSMEDLADSQSKGEIETFVACSGHVTDWHFDFMENFTVQLKGSKRWYLKRGNLTHVIRGATPHYKPDENAEQQMMLHRLQDEEFKLNNPKSYFDSSREDVECVVLNPGDLLYFPAGCWHRVECLEDSISVNLSLVGSTWADIASNIFRQQLWRNDIFRSMVCVNRHCGASVQPPSKLISCISNQLRKDDGSAAGTSKTEQLDATWNLLQKGCNEVTNSLKQVLNPRTLLPRAALLPRLASLDCTKDSMVNILQHLYGEDPRHCHSNDEWPTSLQLHPGVVITNQKDVPQYASTSSEDFEGDYRDPEETPQGMEGYLVFVNMGNEEIQPMVRLVLHVSKVQSLCMEHLRKRCSGNLGIPTMRIHPSDLLDPCRSKNQSPSFRDLPNPQQQLLRILRSLDLLLDC